MDENICHLTYSHSDYSDLWDMYFYQNIKYFPVNRIKHFFATNIDYSKSYEGVEKIKYDQKQSYPKRLLECINKLKDYDYIFFDHEDMILFNTPEYSELEKYYQYMKSAGIDHIRMIKGGECEFESIDSLKTLFKLNNNSKWLFSIQPGFWKRETLINILEANKNLNIWDFEVKSQKIVRKMKLKFYFSHNDGAKRGMHHYDNSIYPYIATAITKGRWNMKEYEAELNILFKIYSINVNERGTNL